jgi:hypothetical protein
MDLEARVELLERRCRRMFLAIFAMAAVAMTAAFVRPNQATTQPIIRTESLEIVDSNGRVHARLARSDADTYALMLQTADGRPRLSLVAGERGSGINLFPSGQSSGVASLTADQDAVGLILRGGNGVLRARMLVDGDRARLGLWNADGSAVFTAPSSGIPNN